MLGKLCQAKLSFRLTLSNQSHKNKRQRQAFYQSFSNLTNISQPSVLVPISNFNQSIYTCFSLLFPFSMPVCILSQLTHKMLLYSYSLTHSLHFYFCSYFINSDTHTQHPQQPYTEHSHTHIFLMHMHTATSPALSQSYTGHYRTLTYAHVSKLLHPHTTSSASLHA